MSSFIISGLVRLGRCPYNLRWTWHFCLFSVENAFLGASLCLSRMRASLISLSSKSNCSSSGVAVRGWSGSQTLREGQNIANMATAGTHNHSESNKNNSVDSWCMCHVRTVAGGTKRCAWVVERMRKDGMRMVLC